MRFRPLFCPSLKPDWIAQVFAFFIILGFPVALVLSWAYDLTPQGVVRADQVSLSESVTNVTGRKLDFAIIGALVVALGFVVLDNYVLVDSDQEAVVQEITTPIVGPAAESPAPVVVEEQRELTPPLQAACLATINSGCSINNTVAS